MDARLDYLTDEMCQMNTRVGRIARRQVRMAGFAPSPSPSPETSDDEDDDVGADEDDASSSSDDDLLVSCPLSFVTKMGSSFGFESSLVPRRRVSIGHF